MSNNLKEAEDLGVHIVVDNEHTNTLPLISITSSDGSIPSLAVNIQENPLDRKRVKYSDTIFDLPFGQLEVSGALGASKKAHEKKGRSGKYSTGDLHMVDLIYIPGVLLACVQENFDFNSPLAKPLAKERVDSISPANIKELRKVHRIRTNDFADHDVVGQQKMAQWTNSNERDDWIRQATTNLHRSLLQDSKLGKTDIFSHIMPATQLESMHTLQSLWEYQSLFIGDLHRDIDTASESGFPENYFGYNFNCVLQYILTLIPLVEPSLFYRDSHFNEKQLIQISLQSNADLLATIGDDIGTVSQKLIDYQHDIVQKERLTTNDRKLLARNVTHVDSNAGVDRLINLLKTKSGLTVEEMEQELIRKVSDGTYLTFDTIRDWAPSWSSFQAAHSTIYPTNETFPGYHVASSSQTDGVTNIERQSVNKYSETNLVSQILQAAHWHNLFKKPKQSKYSIQQFALDDDGSQSNITFKSKNHWHRN